MTRLLVRILLSALAFLFVLPMIDGIGFHGNFVQAIGLGAFFALVSWLVGRAAAFLSAMLTVGTLGLALLVLVPLWFCAWWLLPMVTLRLVADIMPSYLTVAGWWPAFWGGLVMFLTSALTAEPKKSNAAA